MPSQTDERRIILQQTEQLQQAQHELEALRVEYRDFVYAVAHDLTGPLRQIEGFANIILSAHGDQFDDKTKRQFGLIIGGSEKGKTILEALLAYSRLITSVPSYTAVDCTKVIEDVITEFAILIETAGAVVQYKEGSDAVAPVVYGDKTQLYQVFYHLIHNALHFRKSTDTPIISIETRELERHWQFCITDNGIGIREKMVGKIFTVLKRAVAEKDYAGTGMGLTIAKSIVQRHGGKIWVESEAGSGSSFYFTLSKDKQHD